MALVGGGGGGRRKPVVPRKPVRSGLQEHGARRPAVRVRTGLQEHGARKPVAPRGAPSRPNDRDTGGGGGRPAGGGGGNISVRDIPSLLAFLAGDLTYQQQQRRFGKTWADFFAELQRQRGDVSTETGVAERGLSRQRGLDLRDLTYGFAGQGLLHSGLFARDRGEYEQEYGERVSELRRQRDRSLSSLSAEETKFKGEQTLAKQEAKEEAARRRAERYKLTPK